MSSFPVARVAPVVSACVLLALLSACGGKGDNNSLDQASLQLPESRSLAQLVTEVQQLAQPESVSDEDWQMLSDELIRVLSSSGKDRFVSAIPPGDKALVDDFTADGDSSSAKFGWTYRNPADYDQNGEVNAADLTQIAVHLGKNTESSDWEAARLADGDNNGIVSISDITPLGLNFRNSVQAYRLENSADGSGGWTEVATVTVAQGSIPQGGGDKLFTHLMNGAPDGHFRVVPFAGSEDGPASNTAQLTPSDPSPGEWNQPGGGPEAQYFTPLSGPTGPSVDYSRKTLSERFNMVSWQEDGFLYSVTGAGELVRRDGNGDRQGSFEAPGLILHYALGDDDCIYLTTDNNQLIKLDSNLSEQWSFDGNGTAVPYFLASHSTGKLICGVFDPQAHPSTGRFYHDLLVLDSNGSMLEEVALSMEVNELAFDDTGNAYVMVSTGLKAVELRRYDFSAAASMEVLWTPVAEHETGANSELRIGGNGQIYFIDGQESDSVNVLDSSGNELWSVPFTMWALDSNDVLYTVPDIGWTIEAHDAAGNLITSWDAGGSGSDLHDMFANGSGRIWWSNSDGLQSLHLDDQPVAWLLADEELDNPSADADGNLYISNGFSIKRISSAGALEWTLNRDPAYSPPVFAGDGTLYMMSGADLVAFDSSLQEKWRFDSYTEAQGVFESGEAGPAILANGDIACVTRRYDSIAVSTDSELVVVTPSGSEAWRIDFDLTFSHGMRIGSDNTIYLATYDNADNSTIHSVDGTTGSENWSVDIAAGGSGGTQNLVVLAAAGGDLIFLATNDGFVHCYDAAGNQLYSVDSTYNIAALTALDSGKLLVRKQFGSGLACLDEAGAEQWDYQAPTYPGGNGSVISTAVAPDGELVVRCNTALERLDSSGNVIWSVDMGYMGEGSEPGGQVLIDVDGNIFDIGGINIYAYDSAGNALWDIPIFGPMGSVPSFPFGGLAPVILPDGRILCMIAGEQLIIVD